MVYAHEELMNELEITYNNLPSEIRKKVISFNQKKRMVFKPESIALLEAISDDIASDITAWHYANSDDSEEDEDEQQEQVEQKEKKEEIEEPIHVEQKQVIVEKPIMEQGGTVVSHVENIEVQEEQKKS